jgi:hypothetical protein
MQTMLTGPTGAAMSTPMMRPMMANLVGSMIDCAHIDLLSPHSLNAPDATYCAIITPKNGREVHGLSTEDPSMP